MILLQGAPEDHMKTKLLMQNFRQGTWFTKEKSPGVNRIINEMLIGLVRRFKKKKKETA